MHERKIIRDDISKIAEAIHNNYNSECVKEGIEHLRYSAWADLSDDLKKSNVDQANHIVKFLNFLGYNLTDESSVENEIIALNNEEVEKLAKMEHDRWVVERKNSGWKYGPVKDIENKISPYMVQWKDLISTIQDYDRQAVKAFIPILNNIGLKVFVDERLKELDVSGVNAANAPLIISVIGHRDVIITPEIENEIDDLFITLQRKYVHTDLILMSDLADGANREVAKIALKKDIRIIGVIANSEEWFIDNSLLNDPDSYADYLCVKNKCMSVCCVPAVSLEKDPNLPFRAVNAYMVSNSHLLIALWDGYAYNDDEYGKENAGTYGAVKQCVNGIEHDLIGYVSPSMYKDADTESEMDAFRSVEDCLVCWFPIDRKGLNGDLIKKRMPFHIDWDTQSPRYIVPHLLLDEIEKMGKMERYGFSSHKPISSLLDRLNLINCKIVEIRTDNKIWVNHPHIVNSDERLIMNMYEELEVTFPNYYLDMFLKIDEFNAKVGFSEVMKFVADDRKIHDTIKGKLVDITYSLFERSSTIAISNKKILDYECRCWENRYNLHTVPNCPSKKNKRMKKWGNESHNMEDLKEASNTTEVMKKMKDYSNKKDEDDKSVNNLLERIRNNRYGDEVVIRYHLADKLALNQQKKSNFSITMVMLLTLFFSLMFSFFMITEMVFGFILAYMLAFILAWVILIRHIRKNEFKNFLDYRLLAETLRVEYYWRLLGIDKRPMSTYYDYTRNQVMWVRAVLKGWRCNSLNNYSKLDEDLADVVETVRRSWVENQRDYHWKKKRDNAAAYMKNDVICKLFSIFTLIISLLGLLLSYNFIDFNENETFYVFPSIVLGSIQLSATHNLQYLSIIKIGMIVCTVMTVYFISKAGQIYGGTPEHIQAKLNIFIIADSRLRYFASNDVQDKKINQLMILRILGDQSIRENSEWVFEHSTKDISSINMPRREV